MNNTDKKTDLKFISQMLVDSMYEIVGKASMKAILNFAGISDLTETDSGIEMKTVLDAGNWNKINSAVIDLFGKRGGQGILLQSGRVFFKNFLRRYGLDIGMMDQAFRLLPKRKRIRAGFEILSRQMSRSGVMVCTVLDDASYWYWKIDYEDVDLEYKTCFENFLIGMLQEFMSWSSGGKYYPIKLSDQNKAEQPVSIIQVQKEFIS